MDKFQKVDEYGQGKVIEQLVKIFNGKSLEFDQHFIDKSTVDIEMKVTTNNNMYNYVIEAKDRYYNHDAFGGEWLIEKKKYDELMKRKGKCYYANTFYDDYLVVWNLNELDITELRKEVKELPYKTLSSEFGKKQKEVIYLPVSKACYCNKFI